MHTTITAPAKPLLRGWFHAAAAVASLILTALLVWQGRGNAAKAVSLAVFGATMIELYTVSAVYHLGHWAERARRVLRSLDHANIFVYIAGTYTPLTVVLLAGWERVALLTAVWSLAVAGLVVARFTSRLPRWISPVLYVAMGWVAVLAMPAFVHAASWGLIALMLAGGIMYSLGALIYGRRWPNPFPRVFGFHEIFHLFVIAGSAIFITAIWLWVVRG